MNQFNASSIDVVSQDTLSHIAFFTLHREVCFDHVPLILNLYFIYTHPKYLDGYFQSVFLVVVEAPCIDSATDSNVDLGVIMQNVEVNSGNVTVT